MKKIISVVGAVGLVSILSLHALAAPAATTVIKDPMADANGINDQGTGDGSVGDQTAASAGTVSDILSVDLSSDAKNLYVNFLTQAAPPATTGVGFRARFNPTATPGTQCVAIEVYYPGANNALDVPVAFLKDSCGGTTVQTPLKVLGTMVTVPRKADKAFAKGAKLTAPQAQSFLYVGTADAGVAGGTIDTTKVGTDYTFKN
jgi:hypothetical protein